MVSRDKQNFSGLIESESNLLNMNKSQMKIVEKSLLGGFHSLLDKSALSDSGNFFINETIRNKYLSLLLSANSRWPARNTGAEDISDQELLMDTNNQVR